VIFGVSCRPLFASHGPAERGFRARPDSFVTVGVSPGTEIVIRSWQARDGWFFRADVNPGVRVDPLHLHYLAVQIDRLVHVEFRGEGVVRPSRGDRRQKRAPSAPVVISFRDLLLFLAGVCPPAPAIRLPLAIGLLPAGA
jgi:hypothetical protein